MFAWLTQRKRMKGGLYFGPAGWSPDHIEPLPAASGRTLDFAAQPLPKDRRALIHLLEQLHIDSTSAITPGLLHQLRDLGDRTARALVLNLLPTQPESALPHALTKSSLDDLTTGLAAIRQAVKPKRTILVFDRHDWRTRGLWRRASKKRRYTFVKLLNRYPQAHPTILMRSLFGKRLSVGRSPARTQRLFLDPVGIWALGRYLRTGQPFDSRPVQLFPAACTTGPLLVMALLGETVASLCQRHNIPNADMQVIVNGVLAGEEADADTRIAHDTESIALRERPVTEQATACFSCGWCLDVCPTALNPVHLLELAEHAQRGIESPAVANQLRSLDARESLHCIGCGLCSYVCPTRLPLTQQTLRLRTWVATANTRQS